MLSHLKIVARWLKPRLVEASTFAGLAYLIATLEPRMLVAAVICAVLAIVIPEKRK